MVRKIIVALFVVVLLSSLVVAQSSASSIRVKTLPGHTVYLSIVDPTDDSYNYRILKGISDEYGDTFFEYATNKSSERTFSLRVKVKKASTQVFPEVGVGELYEDTYNIGEDIYLEAFNEGDEIILTPELDDVLEEVIEDVVNNTDTINSTNEMVNNTNGTLEGVLIEDSDGSLLAGYSVSELVRGPAIYGGVGAIVLLGIIALFIFGRRRKSRVVSNKAVSSGLASNKKSESNDGDLSKAETKLKAVQAEIQRLKGQDKVSEVRKRIAAEEEELRRLRSGKI